MNFSLVVNKNNTYKAMGWLVKYVRTLKGYSLRDLGELTNISHTLIANIEKGKVISSKNTIEDLLNVLDVKYSFEEEIIDEFVPKYDKVFNYLYNYEYEKAYSIMEELEDNESVYNSSVVVPDYYLLKYFYLGMMDQIIGENETMFLSLIRVSNYLSANQTQLLFLIKGIYYYNKGNFRDSKKELVEALKIGDSNLDSLISTFLVKCNVGMYEFMDALKTGKGTIISYEYELNYSRAMELRLSFAKSYFLVHKFDDAINELNKIERFSKNYNTPYLYEQCCMLKGAIYMYKKEFVKSKYYFDFVKSETSVVRFAKIRLALRSGDHVDAIKQYKSFLQYNKMENSLFNETCFKISMHKFNLLDLTDKEYLKSVNLIIEVGEKGCDIEMLSSGYNLLIEYYKEKRMYKKALQISEKAMRCRFYGCEE